MPRKWNDRLTTYERLLADKGYQGIYRQIGGNGDIRIRVYSGDVRVEFADVWDDEDSMWMWYSRITSDAGTTNRAGGSHQRPSPAEILKSVLP